MKHIVFSFLLTALLFCSCGTHAPKSEITAEMAFEGVSNYCHSAYDWRYVPTLDVRNEAGSIDIFDYLEQKNGEF
jgi:hypothetical protein